jgi:hypothetical protein
MDVRTRFENCIGRVGFVAEYPVIAFFCLVRTIDNAAADGSLAA